MKLVFLVIAATVVCVALFAMVETVWTVMNRPAAAVERFERANERFGKSRAYLIAALIGYLGVVYCGFYGLLFWMPPNWGAVNEDGEFTALRYTVAGLFTLAALPATGLFERYARLLNEIPMWKQTLKGVEQMIDRVHNLPPVIELFSSGRKAAPEDLREADLWWLRAHADVLQRNVSNMIENALARERKAVEDKANAADKAVEVQAQRERKQTQVARIEAALEAALPCPAPLVVDALPVDGTAGWVTIASAAVNARWASLDKIFAALAVPNGRERDELRLTDISVALRAAPDIELPAGLKVVGHYRGGSHSGETEIVATLDGKLVDLAHTARFAMTRDGLCAAFFIAHLMPTYGRFWHSLYNNDYSMLLDRSALVAWLLHSGIEVEPGSPLQGLGRGPGLHVSAAGSVLRAAALGAGATTNLTDFSIELADGHLTESARQLLVRSNTRVLY